MARISALISSPFSSEHIFIFIFIFIGAAAAAAAAAADDDDAEGAAESSPAPRNILAAAALVQLPCALAAVEWRKRAASALADTFGPLRMSIPASKEPSAALKDDEELGEGDDDEDEEDEEDEEGEAGGCFTATPAAAAAAAAAAAPVSLLFRDWW